MTEDEILIYKKGRNSHVNLTRKNIDLKEYLEATGFEALIGYLYLNSNIERLEYLINPHNSSETLQVERTLLQTKNPTVCFAWVLLDNEFFYE